MTVSAANPFLAAEAPSDPRLSSVVRLADLERMARERMHPAAFDYVAGGAGDERALGEAELAWRRWRLRPSVLVDVSELSTASSLVGCPSTLPLAIAPMAAHGLAHADGEIASARAAAAAGVPFTLSTMSSRSIEEVAAATPGGTNFFQLYVQRDRVFARGLVERAAAAGYRALVLTVDLPVLGYRERDRRNGWTLDVPLGNFGPAGGRALEARGDPDTTDAGPETNSTDAGSNPAATEPADGYQALGQQRHVGLTWDDLGDIRSWSSMPLVLKGILSASDARRALDVGADAIVVSNHGARQLDELLAPAAALPDVLAAVGGRIETWVDGGIRRGSEIALALALGAHGVLIGRPALWGLAVAGEAGVARVLAILREELEITMALLGAPSVDHLRPDHAVRVEP
ncbi:MAG TPA: alpha-hydroxy acid oxidase [Candidatus Limnocylindrales bacterium]